MRKAWPVVATAVLVVACIAGLEQLSSLRSLRLLECLLVAVLLGVAAWATRAAVRNLLVAACSLLVGLAVLEAGVLVVDAMTNVRGADTVANDSGMGQYRPLLGWGPVRPGVYRSFKTSPEGRPVFDTHVTIDASLNRRTVPSDGPRPIVFFGDSWVFGDGVEDAETLPQAFADLNKRRIPVLNLAFGGWSPAQNLVALRQGLYAKLIEAPRHFILFTSTFHLERTACRGNYAISQAPRLVRAGATVRYAGPCGAGAKLMAPLMRIARRFALYERIAPMLAAPRRDDVETYVAIIEAFVAEAKRDYGVKTTVLFVPFDDTYVRGTGLTEAQMLAELTGAGVDVLIDHLPKLADETLYSLPFDGHPTALANRARAEEIEAHLREVDPAALDVASTPAD